MVYVGKGLGAIKEAADSMGNLDIIKLKAGESKLVRFLTPPEEIVSVYEHVEQLSGRWHTITCLGKSDCPLCKAGLRAAFRSYTAVVDRDDDKVKIFKLSKKTGSLLVGIIEEYGDLRARDFKVVRIGDKLQTSYQFFAKDPSPFDFSAYADKVPDFEKMVEPKDRDYILSLMSGGIGNTGQGGEETEEGGLSGVSYVKDEDLPF